LRSRHWTSTSLFLLFFIPISVAAESSGDQLSSIRGARLLLPVCPDPPFDAENLAALLRIELLGLGVELGEGGGDDSLNIVVDAPACLPSVIELRIEDSAHEALSQRRLSFIDRPFDERGRVLALAIAELMREALAAPPEEIEMIPEEDGEEEEEVEAVEEDRTNLDEEQVRRAIALEVERALAARRSPRPEPEPRRGELGASLVLRGFPVNSGALLGGQVRLLFRLSERAPLILTLDGEYGSGGGSARRGEVGTQAAGGGVGFGLTGSSGRLDGLITARLWMGRGWTQGFTTLEDVATAGGSSFLLDLSLAAALRIRLFPRVRMRVGLALGYVVVGLVPLSEGREVGGFAGPSFGLDLGIDVSLF
jgi:hypothetical protein